MTKYVIHGLVGTAILAASPLAAAVELNLTTAGASGTINGAFFQQILPRATGTGVIDAFVQIGDASPNTGTEVSAFNTTVNGVLDVGPADNFNHALLLTAVPIVNIGGIDYRQFMLDINQLGVDPLLSLDQLIIRQGAGTGPAGPDYSSFAAMVSATSLVYDMDIGVHGNSLINLNYNLNTGSGSGDMFAYIPNSFFGAGSTYVYLFSSFGIPNNNNDGFEEWAVLDGNVVAIPEPQTYALMLAGLTAVGFMARRRREP